MHNELLYGSHTVSMCDQSIHSTAYSIQYSESHTAVHEQLQPPGRGVAMGQAIAWGTVF